MNAPLPDIARSGAAAALLPLSWVGMDGIALPLRLADAAHGCVAARASVQVNLPRPAIRAYTCPGSTGCYSSRRRRAAEPGRPRPAAAGDGGQPRRLRQRRRPRRIPL